MCLIVLTKRGRLSCTREKRDDTEREKVILRERKERQPLLELVTLFKGKVCTSQESLWGQQRPPV